MGREERDDNRIGRGRKGEREKGGKEMKGPKNRRTGGRKQF
jgi:hypothetical protein